LEKVYSLLETISSVANEPEKIKIVENNQKARMQSIVIAIDKYRQFLEKEFPDNKVGNGPREKAIQDTITFLEKELAILNDKEKHYEFDGKALILYVSNFAKENAIVLYEDTYYLKKDADYFKLTIATAPQLYKKISDTNLINNLDDILSENGK
jgi:hypothetical protein